MSDTMLERLRECERFIDKHFMDNGNTSHDDFEVSALLHWSDL